jgi:N-acetylmuramoyl-L-alanine amidase
MRTKVLVFSLLLSFAPFILFANGKKVRKIVLDAGHGGKDAGARGLISSEKDLTLDVVLLLGKMIKENMPDVEVIYTRTVDEYPSLVARHEVANRNAGDLFISVHVNATAGTTTRVRAGSRRVKKGKKWVTVPVYKTTHHKATSTTGTETYVLGLHRNSQKEDAIGEYSEEITDEAGLLNMNDPQTAIVIAQYTQAYLSRSVTLGNKIQQQFVSQGRRDLGVKQKGLEVLAGSAMPGVLVEIGFINNPEEEEYLNSHQGQKEVATAILKGIMAYKAEAEK